MNWFKVKLVNINNPNDVQFVTVYAKNAVNAASLITKDFPGYLAEEANIIEASEDNT